MVLKIDYTSCIHVAIGNAKGITIAELDNTSSLNVSKRHASRTPNNPYRLGTRTQVHASLDTRVRYGLIRAALERVCLL